MHQSNSRPKTEAKENKYEEEREERYCRTS